MAAKIQYRRLRVPEKHGAGLFDPPLSEAGRLLAENISQFNAKPCELQGRSLAQLASTARKNLLSEAMKYSSAYRDVDLQNADPSRLILSGHQPHLFHPGVWVKNFALSQLAISHQATAINLVIDNDLVKTSSIRVPSGALKNPRATSVAYDSGKLDIPHELYRISDRTLFRSFGSRVAETIKPFVANPLIDQLWPLAIRRSEEENNLGKCIAQARHQFESQLGLQTLEIPLSSICQSNSFQWFTCCLLANLPRFWEIYNQSIGEYREAHRIRNRAQPVPNLKENDGWLEAPFWMISKEDGQRRSLFVRSSGDELILSDRNKQQISLPISADGSAEKAVEVLQHWQQQGVLIRPRALITTMYARLMLSDLFIHGIGGAKYDQVTDLIIERFFGITAPNYLTISATVLLPIQKPRVSREDIQYIDKLFRDIEFRPESNLDIKSQSEADQHKIKQLLHQKEQTLRLATSPSRHLGIRQINEKLQQFHVERQKHLLEKRHQLTEQLRADELLFSREYAFCLYPEKSLISLLLEIVRQNPYIYQA